MYQSNQVKIKKKNPSLLPGRGQTPRGRLSLTLAAIAVNSTCGTVARQPPSLSSHLLSILQPHNIWYQRSQVRSCPPVILRRGRHDERAVDGGCP